MIRSYTMMKTGSTTGTVCHQGKRIKPDHGPTPEDHDPRKLPLAHLPEPEWWVGRALESIGRPVAPQVVQAAVAGLDAAAELPEVLEAEHHEDCSWELHRSVTMRRFELAGLDSELAEALYRLDLDPASHPLYPDVPEVLAALRARGVRVALVSDIHFDLRVDLAEHGIAEFVDAWVLSFEHGFQKPDPRMF